MSATLIRNHASSADANPQVVSLAGKTPGKDLFVLFSVAATPTLPSLWVEEDSILAGSFYVKLWRLPAAANTVGVTQLSIALNAARGLSAIIWEDELDTNTPIYFDLDGTGPNSSTPSLWGSTLHTFAEYDETFAVFVGNSDAAGNPITFDIVSYDQGYTEFGDSGSGALSDQMRVWAARLPNTAMANNGVTATGNGNADVGHVDSATSGMIAYNVGVSGGPAPPANTVIPALTGAPVAPGTLMSCSTGTWVGDAPITYAYQWKKNNNNIVGATASTYTLQPGDAGSVIKCTVTATNGVGSSPADSNLVPVDIIPGDNVITQYASSANADPHVIPLAGKTNGRDLFCFATAAAIITVPSPWVVLGGGLHRNGGFSSVLLHLPAADNGAGVTELVLDLNGPVSLAAVVWEDIIVAGTIYVDFRDVAGNMAADIVSGPPPQQGSGLHTFPLRTESFAFFGVRSEGTSDLGITGVSYDQGYIPFADSGQAEIFNKTRSFLAYNPDTEFVSNGVVASYNPEAALNNGMAGIIAYDAAGAEPQPPTNIVLPAVTGTPTTGQQLACSQGSWTGDAPITYTYQWQRNGINIGGATANVYTLQEIDEGNQIRCVVTATNSVSVVTANSNAITPLQEPANTIAPAITGTAQTGQTLACSTGTWSNSPSSYTYQWKRNNVNIVGATANNYLLTAVDEGVSIKCTVISSNVNGAGIPTDSNAVIPIPVAEAPANTSAPVVTGTPNTGSNLSCTQGTWTGNSPITYAYQWQRNGVNIGGETSNSYILQEADEGSAIRCRVTATNSVSSGAANSNAITPLQEPINTIAPTIMGAAETWQTLTCFTGTWSNSPAEFAYQWKRNNVIIGGATASTYVIQDTDEGVSIKCTVTASNVNGAGTPADSNTVVPLPPPINKLTIVQENALPGENLAQVTIAGAGDPANLGFARKISLEVGETQEFSYHSNSVEIDIYRIGWYGGSGWNLKDTIVNTPASQPNPVVVPSSNDGTTCEGWSVTATWDVPDNATPGLYVAVSRSVPGPNASYAPFVVYDTSRSADIMVKVSDSTWGLAYNYYGTPAAPFANGKSWYGSNGPIGGAGGITNRSHYATYMKPIITREGVSQTYWLNAEASLIRWLERNGYDVTYSASRDWRQHSSAPVLPACKVYISSGHDEYWDQGMNDKWKTLRNSGKHLIFMSGNERFWRIRYDADGDGAWCYKDTMPGPGGHVAGTPLDPVSWTGTWKDTRWAQREPENLITGTDFRLNGLNDIALQVEASDPERNHVFWRHTDVAANGFTSEVGIIGFEADEQLPAQPPDSVTYLARRTFAANGVYADDNGQNYSGTKADFDYAILSQRYGSGAAVIGFGSNQWAWGLDASHDRGGANNELKVNSRIQQATANLLVDLGAVPNSIQAGLVMPTPAGLTNYGLRPGAGIVPDFIEPVTLELDPYPQVTLEIDSYFPAELEIDNVVSTLDVNNTASTLNIDDTTSTLEFDDYVPPEG